MIYHPSDWDLNVHDPTGIAFRELERAMRVRRLLPSELKVVVEGKPLQYVPPCHVFVRAYGNVFGLQVVDGICVRIEHIESSLTERKVTIGEIGHSWLELNVAPRCRVILDIFPDLHCPVFPIVQRFPHPAYQRPSTEAEQTLFRDLKRNAEFNARLADVTAAIQHLAETHSLLQLPT